MIYTNDVARMSKQIEELIFEEKEKFYDEGKKLVKKEDNYELTVFLKKKLSNFFDYSVISIDPTDERNTKDMGTKVFRNLIQNNFIFAQREYVVIYI